jgi:3-phenylpropionate/cinnamic acid dioxygenase small subunit
MVRPMNEGREAIEALIYGYATAIDRGDLDEFGGLFAEATLAIAGSPVEAAGADQVRSMVTKGLHWYDGTPRTRHITTNVVVTVDGDGDRASAQSSVVVYQALDDLPLQVVLVAHYDDEIRMGGRALALLTPPAYLRPVGRPLEALHQARAACPALILKRGSRRARRSRVTDHPPADLSGRAVQGAERRRARSAGDGRRHRIGGPDFGDGQIGEGTIGVRLHPLDPLYRRPPPGGRSR